MSISNVYTIMYICIQYIYIIYIYIIYIYNIYIYICMLYIYYVDVDKNICKSITGQSKMLQRV